MSDKRTLAKEKIGDWAVRVVELHDEMKDEQGCDPGDDTQVDRIADARSGLFEAGCELGKLLGCNFQALRGLVDDSDAR